MSEKVGIISLRLSFLPAITTFTGLFAIGLNNYILLAILPQLGVELNQSEQIMGFLTCFYALPLGLLAPVFGPLSDRVGRRKTMLIGMFVFIGAGLVCRFATNFQFLLVGRMATGLGAAIFVPASYAYQPSIGGSQTTDAFLTELATGATKTCTVSNTSDDAATSGSFRNALLQSPKCDIINFNLAEPSTINITNTPLPQVPLDVTINGLCSNNQPVITIKGTGITGTGLYLSGGDSIGCLEVQHFSGVQLQATGGSARNNLDHVIASN